MADASTFFPGQLFQNPDGSFSLNVTGQLHAQGLNLDAGTDLTPPSVDRIRWIRAADGAVVADLYADSAAGAEEIAIRAIATAPADTSKATLQIVDDLGHNQANISMTQTNRGVNGVTVSAHAGNNNVILLDDTRKSNYLQIPGLSQRLDIAAGYIDGRAASFGVLFGVGFTVVRTAVGKYTVTLNPAMTNAAGQSIVAAWSYGLSGASVINGAGVTSSARLDFSINALTGGAPVDDLFAFIAVG